MMTRIWILFFLFFLFSCNGKETESSIEKPQTNLFFNDLDFVVVDSFKKGDTRRYGVFPNKPINSKLLKNILFLAKNKLPITFSKGYYKTNLRLEGTKDISIIFNDVILAGTLNIINKDTIRSERIQFKGKLTILDKLFIRKTSNVFFDDVLVKSDTVLNIKNKKNRGVSIYAGSKNIYFRSLTIKQTGGNLDHYYLHSAAALQVHGWNNNPENINIKNLKIFNAARTAIYLTGKNHILNNVTITNFGLGNSKNMFGIGGTNKNEEKDFTGLWINRCSNCSIDSLLINNPLQKGIYSLQLDSGIPHNPSFINNIHFDNFAKRMLIKDDRMTNILVKHEY